MTKSLLKATASGRLVSVFCLVLGMACHGSAAQDIASAVGRLEARLKSNVYAMRHLVSDSKLRYDEAGNLTGKSKPGQWTWHGHVEVTDVSFKDGLLRIDGNRILLRYRPASHEFSYIRGTEKINIEIKTAVNRRSIDFDKELKKVFLAEGETVPINLMEYWLPFMECMKNPKDEECQSYEQKALSRYVRHVYRVPADPDVTPPKVKSRVDPDFTVVAREALAEGTVIFSAIVDKEGRLQILRIIQPLGFGLEEGAANAMSRWKFEPGSRAGEPVDVQLTIEVNFNWQR